MSYMTDGEACMCTFSLFCRCGSVCGGGGDEAGEGGGCAADYGRIMQTPMVN